MRAVRFEKRKVWRDRPPQGFTLYKSGDPFELRILCRERRNKVLITLPGKCLRCDLSQDSLTDMHNWLHYQIRPISKGVVLPHSRTLQSRVLPGRDLYVEWDMHRLDWKIWTKEREKIAS